MGKFFAQVIRMIQPGTIIQTLYKLPKVRKEKVSLKQCGSVQFDRLHASSLFTFCKIDSLQQTILLALKILSTTERDFR